MLATQHPDDNPCRPRHFKPPPCAPVIPEGPARQAVEICRTRLLVTGLLFAVIFAVVALRVVDVVLIGGGAAESSVGRIRPIKPPSTRPRRYRRPQRPPPRYDTRQPIAVRQSEADHRCRRRHAKACQSFAEPQRRPGLRQADLGEELCLDQAPSDAARAIRRQPVSGSRGSISSMRIAASIPMAG